jgi:DNA-binding MarR family transcriptional regulator
MEILEKESINPTVLGSLMFIKLNSSPTEFVTQIIKEKLFEFPINGEENYYPIKVLEDRGYIKYIKTGRKDPWYRVRLSEKGEKILKEMNQKPQHELAQYMLDYIKQEYLRVGADNLTRGGDKLLNRISEFLYLKEAYTDRMIRAVVKAYVNQFEFDRTYMNNMETLIFKPTNAYATKWTAEDSPLCKFIDKNQDKVKYEYKNV